MAILDIKAELKLQLEKLQKMEPETKQEELLHSIAMTNLLIALQKYEVTQYHY